MNEKLIEVTLDNGSKRMINAERLTECPDCKENSVRAKELGEGGGIVCITEGCKYWFCY